MSFFKDIICFVRVAMSLLAIASYLDQRKMNNDTISAFLSSRVDVIYPFKSNIVRKNFLLKKVALKLDKRIKSYI